MKVKDLINILESVDGETPINVVGVNHCADEGTYLSGDSLAVVRMKNKRLYLLSEEVLECGLGNEAFDGSDRELILRQLVKVQYHHDRHKKLVERYEQSPELMHSSGGSYFEFHTRQMKYYAKLKENYDYVLWSMV